MLNAQNVEDARKEFEKFLIKSKKKIDCLDSVKKNFLHHIHEVKNVPQKPVLINFEEFSTDSDSFGSISCAVPQSCRGLTSFTFHEENEKENEMKPFLVF
jgi:hypothetical protein